MGETKMALRSSLKRITFTAGEKRALFALALLFFVGSIALWCKSAHQTNESHVLIENASLYETGAVSDIAMESESLEVDLRGGDRNSSERDTTQVAYLTGDHPELEITGRDENENVRQSGITVVNINFATTEELDELPGIGPVLAGRIIEYREVHGPFQDIHDLLLIRGIGERTFQRVRPYIAVQP